MSSSELTLRGREERREIQRGGDRPTHLDPRKPESDERKTGNRCLGGRGVQLADSPSGAKLTERLRRLKT